MKVPRRVVLGTMGGALAGYAGASRAQAPQKVTMAVWGGGGARAWRETFAARFTASTGIPANIVEVADPPATVMAAQGTPQYNVIIASAFQAADLARRGLVEEMSVDAMPELREIPESYWVRDPKGGIVGMPVYFIWYGIVFNTDLAKAADFQSWTSLADPKWQGQLSMIRPNFLASYDMTLFSHIAGGTEADITPGLPLLKALAQNAASVYSSMASLQVQLARGEVTAVPFYNAHVQIMRREGQRNVDIVMPKEGGLAIPYVVLVPKGATDQDAARTFIRAAADPVSQLAAAKYGYLPLNPQAKLPPDLLQEMGMSLEEVRARTWSPNWYTVADHWTERVRLAEKIIDEAR